MKRAALILLGLTGLASAVAGSLAMVSASHGCTLARTGTACYTPISKVFVGIALLVCGFAVVAVVVLKGWADHRGAVEKKRWRHLETVRLPAGGDPFSSTHKSPAP